MRRFYALIFFCTCPLFAVNAQYVNYGSFYDDVTFNRPVDINLAVGSTVGTGNVSGTGASTYNITLPVPPGTNGATPAISLDYNSQRAGSGLLGYGWGISGLSFITRVPETVYHDGLAGPVELNFNDKFALDGARLMLKAGNYGADGSTYGTETENFATVTAKGVAGNGPQWFEMVTKDGVVMEFGKTLHSTFGKPNGGTILMWALNKIQYPGGNYIVFNYAADDAAIRISEIEYTGNTAAALLPYNKIKFEYKGRIDANVMMEADLGMSANQLLDKITITTESAQIFKTFQLNYAHDEVNSYLKEIKETGSDATALNTTIFKYGNAPTYFTTASSTVVLNANAEHFTGDFDANGVSDLLSVERKIVNDNNKNYLYHKNFTVYHKDDPSQENYYVAALYELPSNALIVQQKNIYVTGNFIANDYTGDGADDILSITTSYSGNQRMLNKIRIYTSVQTPGATFPISFDSTEIAVSKSRVHASGNFIFPGDFNGDGLQDILTLLGANVSGIYGAQLHSAVFGFTPFFNDIYTVGPAFFPVTTWAECQQVHILDFNGDGKSDIMLIKDNNCEIFALEKDQNGFPVAQRIYFSSSSLTKNHIIYFGDFNGDRKTDMLTRASLTDNNVPWVRILSTGTDLFAETFVFQKKPDITGVPNDHHLSTGDFNGDGRSDIYHGWEINAANSNLDIYYSKGIAFKFNRTPFTELGAIFPLIADMNGDGRSDIINRKCICDPIDVLYFKKDGKENLLQKVANGMNHVTEWSYKNLTEPGNAFYKQGSLTAFPVNNIKQALYAVSGVKSKNGIGGNSEVTYSYEEGRLYRSGKGFMGFKKLVATDVTANIKTISENEFNTTYYVAAPQKTAIYLASTNTLLSEKTFSNEFIPQGPNGSKRFLHRVKSVTENNVFEGRTVTSTNNTFDNFGNVTQNTVNNSNVETTVTNTVFGAYPGIIPNKPTSVTVIKTRTGQPAFSVTTGTGYNAVGQLTSKTDFSGLPKSVSTAYEYFPLGNLKKTTVTPSGLPARTTSAVYDAKGRYATSTVNELGQTSSATYDAKWGKPLTVTGIDGLTTTMEYDGFGREKKTTFQQGYSITQTYGWDISGNSVWYAKTTHPGKPDVKTWYDLLGREIKTETEGFQGQTITQANTYDAKGNLSTSTAPYKTGEPVLTTTTQYDAHNRPFNISSSGPFGTTTIGYGYSAGKLTTTTTTPSGTSSKTTDATGQVTSATDNGGTLGYTYYSHGGLKEVSDGLRTLTSSQYDAYGRQTSLTDLNAGTTTYDYNALGQLAGQTNANNKTHTMQYDLLGRNTSRTGPEGITTYEYYPTGSGASVNQIKKVTGFAGNLEEYTYDAFGRLQTSKQTVDAAAYTTTYGYNMYDDVTSVLYPSGFGTNHAYDANGFPTTIKNTGNTITLFTNNGISGLGQNTSYALGNGKTSAVSYEYGVPKKFTTSGIQDLELSWDYAKGNLTKRKDYIKSKEESFTYDNLDRLLTATVAGKAAQTITYQPSGNISSKSDAGQTFSYHQTKIHALTGIVSPTTAIPVLTQDITYTAFNQPEKIIENGSGQPYELTYTYGADYQRLKGTMKKNNVLINTHYYFGNGYEKDVTPAIADKHLHYIGSPAGLVAIVIRENNVDQYYYTYTDHLGSLLTTTAANGTVLLDQNFDAWGRLRHPANWDYANVPAPTSYLYRGFTGHEHLTNFNLINMNGRMYDPVVGRVLSVDNYVQDPFGTQDYNRYSYAKNNPLKYNDPDGNNPLIGALIGGLGYTVGIGFSKGGFDNWNWNEFGISVAMGFISSGFSAGIGSATAGISSGLVKAGVQMAAHGAFSGAMSMAQGGSFGTGLLTGAAGSAMGSATAGFGPGLQIGASAAFGGVVSELSGGNFWKGAAQAGIVAGFNHAAHALDDRAAARLQRRILADGRLSLGEANLWARKGGGRDLTVDASKLDLGWVDDEGWNSENGKHVQTLFNSEDGLVHGRIYLERVSAQRATIQDAAYDFDQKGKYFDNFLRNSFNTWGRWNATHLGLSNIIKYTIHYNGAAIINQYRLYKPY
ncbi:FG-GAP-like repeat-containing protein [Dyadobacter bucti]|uniref:FG-GAP-like repeat-containing protein n=1 Tax=Dyadobacter bucti TaxID=2572203 RepID=UPI001107D321|nr:FG-GAP-like repeat-containing protein [Dyadobacter bucti]